VTASTVVRRHWPTVRALAIEFVTGRPPRPPTRLQRLDTRCRGSLGQVHRRLVMNGTAGCEVCGHIVNICQHPDGGPGPHIAPHDLEGTPI
jgi:hypothetical protein